VQNQFTAIIEKEQDWISHTGPEIPGTNGQGKTTEECKTNLADGT